jgi:hypothetical protein
LILDGHDFIPIEGVDRTGDVVQVVGLAQFHGNLLLKGAKRSYKTCVFMSIIVLI